MDFPSRINPNIAAQRSPKIFILLTLLIILGCIPLYYTSNKWDYSNDLAISSSHKSEKSPTYHVVEDEQCDIFTGEWVLNRDGPYYTNTTCRIIREHQNCMKYGRPDMEFMKWSWKPKGCEMPIFNPYEFLDMMRNKSLLFIGDSLAVNHMYSLMCLLSQVEYPTASGVNPELERRNYITYNFTIARYLSTFLVKMKENGQVFNLYLDKVDELWANEIQNYDYVILNSAQWFFKCAINYQQVGCRYYGVPNASELKFYEAYQMALRTIFKAINNMENFKGITIFRTISPSHFVGEWNKGGDCVLKRPISRNEATSYHNISMYLNGIQVEEFKKAEKEGKKKGKKFRLMDITQIMLLRPDGHPSRYGHWQNESLVYKDVVLYNDCVHWCLPGPIDSWSEFLLYILKLDGKRGRT